MAGLTSSTAGPVAASNRLGRRHALDFAQSTVVCPALPEAVVCCRYPGDAASPLPV